MIQNKKLTLAGRVISGIAVLPFLMSASMKFMRGPEVMQGMEHLGIPESLLTTLGIIEVLCIVIYLFPATSVLGAVLFTGYMGGTIITHLRVGEPPVAQIVIGLVIWLGLYLREPRLHALLPIRKA